MIAPRVMRLDVPPADPKTRVSDFALGDGCRRFIHHMCRLRLSGMMKTPSHLPIFPYSSCVSQATRVALVAMVDESLVLLQRAWQVSARQAHLPAVEQRLQAAAGLALTRPARTALLYLGERGPLHVSDLAAAAGVDVSTMSRTLHQLGASGYIAREQGEDLRAVRISLTSAGEEAVAQLLVAGQVILREVLAGWSEADRDALSRLLERFANDFAAYLRQSLKQDGEVEGTWTLTPKV